MVSRRNFIKTGVATAAATAVCVKAQNAPAKSLVVIAKGDARECVRKCVDRLGGIRKFVKQGGRVVIKPNMGFPNPPEWGTTTHPDVVKAIAELCVEAGARRIILFDNPLRDAQM
jgi:uncharacterized protein (DUF362 family)